MAVGGWARATLTISLKWIGISLKKREHYCKLSCDDRQNITFNHFVERMYFKKSQKHKKRETDYLQLEVRLSNIA